MNKREFLKLSAGAGASLFASGFSRALSLATPQTFVYKTVGGCELKADVYGADPSTRKPVILWIHGGALIFGTRANPPEWLNTDGRFVVVSIDYRLAPETKLPAIMEDQRDAYTWLVTQGAELFNIDPMRIVVAGQSAGGYSTLMAGFAVHPRPRALLALSGYGDLIAPWYTQPSSFYLQQPKVEKGEAEHLVGVTCTSGAADKSEDQKRSRFYLYTRQQGIWPQQVAAHDPQDRRWYAQYCPVHNVSRDYPPTVLIHGTADTDVPFDESVKMDKQLSHFKVKHEFIQVPDGSHCLWKESPDVKAPIFQKATDFVRAQIG